MKNKIKINTLGKWVVRMKSDRTGLGPCPVAGFDISGVGPSGSTIRKVKRFYFTIYFSEH